MLEGITVLNQTEITILTDMTAWIVIGIAIVIFVVYFGIGRICYMEAKYIPLAIIISFGVGMLLFTWLKPYIIDTNSNRYRYECLIDESVSMTEVHERYEIVEQRGDIWVLEDRE